MSGPGELREGLERSERFTVEGELTTDVGGTIDRRVLSTPGMIGVMERCAAMLAYDHLPEGKATVGFEVCVRHVAAAEQDAECTVSVRLEDVVEQRKLRFAVEVCDGERTIGTGTHERRVIEVEQ